MDNKDDFGAQNDSTKPQEENKEMDLEMND